MFPIGVLICRLVKISILMWTILKDVSINPNDYSVLSNIEESYMTSMVPTQSRPSSIISVPPETLNVPPLLTYWVHSFFSNQPQSFMVGTVISRSIMTNTGAHRAVSSVLFSALYINDCVSPSPITTYFEYSDDTAILLLNVSKTKELVINTPKSHCTTATHYHH